MNLKPRQITDNQDAVAVVLDGGESLGFSERFHRVRCSTLSPKGEHFSRELLTLRQF